MCVPRWLCPLAVAGAAVSLPQPVRKHPAGQRGSECPHRAVVAVSGPLLSPESPSSILPSPSSSLSLLGCSCDCSRGWQRPLPLQPCHSSPVTCAQLSSGHSVLIPGSPLCRGRCSCWHQLGSWPGASLTHLHEGLGGKQFAGRRKKLPGLFQRRERRGKSMKSVQKFKKRLKQKIRDIP